MLRTGLAAVRPWIGLGAVLAAACASSAGGLGADGLPGRVDLALSGRPQARSLSCESRSACDLLAWAGIQVAEEEFRRGLPLSDNPDLGFVGDVDGPGEQLPPAGYGVHEQPIAMRLRAYGLACQAAAGVSTESLRRELAAGRPLIVWATGMLDAPQPVRYADSQGRAFLAVRGEHTFLAMGYTPGEVILLDPAQGTRKTVKWARFERSFEALGRRVVWLRPASAEPDVPPLLSPGQ